MRMTDSARLDSARLSDHAKPQMAAYHQDFVDEVKALVAQNDVVVVGMGQNPVVRKARKLLDSAGIKYAYIGHGSYLSGYRRRLAIKLWSGWPWFPQVFVKGLLLGGAKEVELELTDGALKKRLEP